MVGDARPRSHEPGDEVVRLHLRVDRRRIRGVRVFRDDLQQRASFSGRIGPRKGRRRRARRRRRRRRRREVCEVNRRARRVARRAFVVRDPHDNLVVARGQKRLQRVGALRRAERRQRLDTIDERHEEKRVRQGVILRAVGEVERAERKRAVPHGAPRRESRYARRLLRRRRDHEPSSSRRGVGVDVHVREKPFRGAAGRGRAEHVPRTGGQNARLEHERVVRQRRLGERR
mmetsp:Transcript_11580/g.49385  ORF Transcript_11580/g.49385 Transcript_11580/m.49385 type:complete len:231 (-) Transcript_11580:13276-13968(-)